MTPIKRLIVISASAAAGAVAMGALALTAFVWYSSRPVSEKPWNRNAIAAIFDDVSDEKRDDLSYRSLVFKYTLENTTNSDYTLPKQDALKLNARLLREKSFSESSNLMRVEGELFIPRKERVLFSLHVGYPLDTDKVDLTQNSEKRKRIAHYVSVEMPNVNGFVILDPAARYEIDLPAGWR